MKRTFYSIFQTKEKENNKNFSKLQNFREIKIKKIHKSTEEVIICKSTRLICVCITCLDK